MFYMVMLEKAEIRAELKAERCHLEGSLRKMQFHTTTGKLFGIT